MHGEPPKVDQQELAQQTIARAKAALDSGKSPALTQIVEVVREISGHVDTISVQHLGDLIARDPGTMTRILQIANTLFYNPNGTDITSIGQAIHVIGFERIRNLAVSVLLMENVENKMNEGENREIAALALSSGLMTEQLVERYDPANSGFAFVSTALRSYGKMLMSSFMAEDYHKARKLAIKMEADSAFVKVFGVTPLELGRHLLTGSQLPKNLLSTLRTLPEKVLEATEHSPADEILAMADLSIKLCKLVDEPDLDARDFPARAAAVGKRYQKFVKLNKDDMKALVQGVASRLSSLGTSPGLRGFSSPLINRLEALSSGGPLPKPLAPRGPAGLSVSSAERFGESGSGSAVGVARDTLATGSQEIERLVGKSEIDLEMVFSTALQTVQSALQMKQSVLFAIERGSQAYQGWLGHGSLFQAVRGQSVVRLDQKTIFTVCLGRGEDVLIQDPSDKKIQGFVPTWLRKHTQGLPLVLLPLKDQAGVFAIICGISESMAAFELVTRFSTDLRVLRELLARTGPLIRQR